MACLLLRLLLIVTLVLNGAGAPWTMAHPHPADRAGTDAMTHEAGAAGHMHHGPHASHGLRADAAPADTPASCCDGPDCSCGCVLPPMLARTAPILVAGDWRTAPAAEPALRFAGRHGSPPYRPPAV
jgi:hypothetical protein